LDHQNFVDIYQNLARRRSRSFQHNKNGQSGLLGWRSRSGTDFNDAIASVVRRFGNCLSMIVPVKVRRMCRAVAKPSWKIRFAFQSVSIAPTSASATVVPSTLASP
jgi:hypothetical protein